jgi:hypothetical protein
MDDALSRLLEAHVQHELSNWSGPRLSQTLRERVSTLFRWFAEVKLDDVATRAQIVGVVERYAISIRVSGGITELTGEMSQIVFKSQVTAETRLDQIVSPEMYDEFATKVLSLEGVRRELISLLTQSSTLHTISARLTARGMLDIIALAVPISSSVRRAALPAIVAQLGAKLVPELERLAAEVLERHREKLARQTERRLLELLDAERLQAIVDELWDRVAPMRLSEIFAFIGEQDVDDWVVLAREFWLRYRETPFFRDISTELIDYFFDKYGQGTLLALVEDMGVSERMVAEEVVASLQPILEHANDSGALEQHIRGRLLEFYRSPAAAAALGS